ncbi:hypothetical protein CMV_007699 [Castanea mollissima]|uniref:Uncharacterized protein n=1 Tax=Castanea mollissima TaxID=60419 RepID=A0A8J4VSN1_9ROSI|nr:hypothetical protein CMV_007699 [Castanea mollissima]
MKFFYELGIPGATCMSVLLFYEMYIEHDPSARELPPGDHPLELFGFVNEVFQNFVKEWTAEALSRELDYVKLLASCLFWLQLAQMEETTFILRRCLNQQNRG